MADKGVAEPTQRLSRTTSLGKLRVGINQMNVWGRIMIVFSHENLCGCVVRRDNRLGHHQGFEGRKSSTDGSLR